MDDESKSESLFGLTLQEARRILGNPSLSLVEAMVASHSICDSPEATLEDLLACASLRYRSAAWRPTHLLHERTGVPKRLGENGFIVIDVEFWRDYLASRHRKEPK